MASLVVKSHNAYRALGKPYKSPTSDRDDSDTILLFLAAQLRAWEIVLRFLSRRRSGGTLRSDNGILLQGQSTPPPQACRIDRKAFEKAPDGPRKKMLFALR